MRLGSKPSHPARCGVSRYSTCIAKLVICLYFAVAAAMAMGEDSQWIRPTKQGDVLVWGRRDGIVFGIESPQGGFGGPGKSDGPRGLIRVGIYHASQPKLLNFIAVEPVVRGPGRRFDRMAFSEMEMSELDKGQQGKRMWVGAESIFNGIPTGKLETLHEGKATIERLSVRIDVERFTANSAHVYLLASVDSDHPSELRLAAYVESDSPAIEELTVTATMGNYERLRLLWLNDRVITTKQMFGYYQGTDFADGDDIPLPQMLRSGDGDAIAFCTSDESDPNSTPENASAHWVYPLPKLTQYWRVPGYDVQPDLRIRVNARRTYFRSTIPLPGGIAYENFEVRQRYVPGQVFIYGITAQEPWEFYHGPYKVMAAEAQK